LIQEKIWEKNIKKATVDTVINNFNNPIIFQEELKSLINRYANRYGKIIEVGCSTGVTSLLLEDTFDKTLLDLNSQAIKLAKAAAEKLGKKVNCIVADMFKMPFKDKTFDILFNAGVIEHFNEDERIDLLGEYSRILKDDGLMIIAFPNHYSFPYRSAYLFYTQILFGYKWPWPKEFKIYDMHREILSANLTLEKRVVLAKKQIFGFWGVFKPFKLLGIPLRIIDKFFPFEGYLTVLLIKKNLG